MSGNKRVRLPPNWTQHVAPTGHLYYYNAITKESTYTRPIIKEFSRYKYKIPNTNWLVVITNLGSQFYHNTETKESCWQNEVGDLLSDEQKKMLIILIAKTRGLKVGQDVEEELERFLSKEDVEKGTKKLEESNNVVDKGVEQEVKVGPVLQEIQEEQKKTIGLIQGYSSDESSDEEEKQQDKTVQNGDTADFNGTSARQHIDIEDVPSSTEAHQSDTEESSDEANAINLSDLESSEDEEDSSSSEFIKLLEESQINPYEPWEIASLKLINDDRFYSIPDNATRKTLYDSYTHGLLQNQQIEGEVEKKEDELHPFVQFMKLLERVDTPRLFVDFKRQYSEEMDKIDLGYRVKEKHYKEYVIFKKKSDEDKQKIFKQVLSAKIFGKNVKESGANLDRDLTGDPYKVLKSLEDDLNISESIKFQTKYYVVDVKKRIELVMLEASKYT